jgi:hypothetical protein
MLSARNLQKANPLQKALQGGTGADTKTENGAKSGLFRLDNRQSPHLGKMPLVECGHFRRVPKPSPPR